MYLLTLSRLTSLLIPRSLYTITRLLHTCLPHEVCNMRYPHLHAVCYIFNISGRNLAQYKERVPKIRISDNNAWQQHEKRWISGEFVLPHYVDLKRLYEPFSQEMIPRQGPSSQDMDEFCWCGPIFQDGDVFGIGGTVWNLMLSELHIPSHGSRHSDGTEAAHHTISPLAHKARSRTRYGYTWHRSCIPHQVHKTKCTKIGVTV
jgi:hypothetical protein